MKAISTFPLEATPLTAIKRGLFTPIRPSSQSLVKDMLTPYFCLPTASRVQRCFDSFSLQTVSGRSKFQLIKEEIISAIEKILGVETSVASQLTLNDIVAPKRLLVPGLPHPTFQAEPPYRFFYPKKSSSFLDGEGFAPPCLMREKPTQEERALSTSSLILPSCYKAELSKDVSSMTYLSIEIAPPILDQLKNRAAQELQIDKGLLRSSFLGCYVPLFRPEETAKADALGLGQEIGKEITFSSSGLFYADTPADPEIERVVYLRVEDKTLTELREKYLMPEKLLGHSLCMVLFIQKRVDGNACAKETFRLNVSCFAA